MISFKYIIQNIFYSLIRWIPVPQKTGLIKIGNPDENSPVLLTCNYRLTVDRLKHYLAGRSVYLLVANSSGINVWCAASGGEFNNHSVISVLKTSNIEKLVDHRTVILPQLSATGLDTKVIEHKTGWKVVWGPVYAKDIPAYLDQIYSKNLSLSQTNSAKKNAGMTITKFSFHEQLEIATGWGFPISIFLLLFLIFVSIDTVLISIGLVWILSIMIYCLFPLYNNFLNKKHQWLRFKYYDLRLAIVQLIYIFLTIVLTVIGSIIFYNNVNLSVIIAWSIFGFIIIFIITVDLMGSTPVYKSGLSEERRLKITLDSSVCNGAAYCEVVCPKNCFDVDHKSHLASIPRIDQCIQCGACIVQCPFDALHFENIEGDIIPPETIRSFKLNLLGNRLVKVNKSVLANDQE